MAGTRGSFSRTGVDLRRSRRHQGRRRGIFWKRHTRSPSQVGCRHCAQRRSHSPRNRWTSSCQPRGRSQRPGRDSIEPRIPRGDEPRWWRIVGPRCRRSSSESASRARLRAKGGFCDCGVLRMNSEAVNRRRTKLFVVVFLIVAVCSAVYASIVFKRMIDDEELQEKLEEVRSGGM